MFAEDRGWARIIERGAKAHPLGDFRHGPPIRPGLARRRREGALTRDPPFGIRHRPVFFFPGGGGQEHMRARACHIGRLQRALSPRRDRRKPRCPRSGPGISGRWWEVGRDPARPGKRRLKALSMRSSKVAAGKTIVRRVNQETAEQHRVHAGRDCQREIGALGCRRSADIDGDDARARTIRW
jgi:hypothetical protein